MNGLDGEPLAVVVRSHRGQVLMDVNTPVSWVEMTAGEARSLATELIREATSVEALDELHRKVREGRSELMTGGIEP
jgi:hypothetical protein